MQPDPSEVETAPGDQNTESPGGGDHLVTWSSKRILVLQQNDVIRRALIHVLEWCGYLPLEAASADEALEHFRRGTKIDVLVCDFVTDDDTGPGLLARFRRYGPLRAIFLSRRPSNLHEHVDAGESNRRVLSIPFGAGEFLAALRETFGRHCD